MDAVLLYVVLKKLLKNAVMSSLTIFRAQSHEKPRVALDNKLVQTGGFHEQELIDEFLTMEVPHD